MAISGVDAIARAPMADRVFRILVMTVSNGWGLAAAGATVEIAVDLATRELSLRHDRGLTPILK